MFVRFVFWSLADSLTTVVELRRFLRDEGVEAAENIPGLRFQAWLSDEGSERWGAISFWESRSAANAADSLGRARELIGKDPEVGEEFDVEATAEGQFTDEDLSRIGLAFGR